MSGKGLFVLLVVSVLGRLAVTDEIILNGATEREVAQIAASLELKSTHPAAEAIAKKADDDHVELVPSTDFKSIAGKRVTGRLTRRTSTLVTVRGHEYHYSTASVDTDVRFAYRVTTGKGIDGRDGITESNVVASYLHAHVYSMPHGFDLFVANANAFSRS